MKKLMILGGSRYIVPVIEAAHKLGIYVITADYLPNNIAHKFSDEYVNVSIVDKESTLREATKRNIDGIMSFACDPGVITCAYVAEKLGLPSVGSFESVKILQNKGEFRAFLEKHGFNVPNAKSYKDIDVALSDADSFNWPVIVKPTDSAGSKGVTRVDEKDQLEKAIKHALNFSHAKEFIIEDFLLQKGFSSDSDCFSIDGNMVFYSFSAQRFDRNCENPYTPSAYSWPSNISHDQQTFLKVEIQRLVKLLGLGTSIYNIETRECINGKSYIMEVSPRGGGNRLAEMVYLATGVDLITEYVKFCVGLPLNRITQKPYYTNIAEIILHIKKDGRFKGLRISKLLEKNVVEKDIWIDVGTVVKGFRGANDAIGTLVLKFDTQEELNEIIGNQDLNIEVIVE